MPLLRKMIRGMGTSPFSFRMFPNEEMGVKKGGRGVLDFNDKANSPFIPLFHAVPHINFS